MWCYFYKLFKESVANIKTHQRFQTQFDLKLKNKNISFVLHDKGIPTQHLTIANEAFWVNRSLTLSSRVFLRAVPVAQVQLDAWVSRLSFSSQNHPLLDRLVTVIPLAFPHLSIRTGGRTLAAVTVHPASGSAECQEQRRWTLPAEARRLSAAGSAFSNA